MSKRIRKPVAGRDYQLLDNGVIAVGRCFPAINAPYDKRDRVRDYLSLVDHDLEIRKRKVYKRALLREETAFNTIVRQLKDQGKFLVVVFQGRDGAGKSGATQRIMESVDYDPKVVQWIPIGPPTDEERAHPFLWRFFKDNRMPEIGTVRIFDRSWAERVLVEPVMGITKPKDVRRSYGELRTFEWLLRSQGGIVIKIWLDISKDEQGRRFKARAAGKPWKVSPSDKIARKHWDDYTEAANEMFHRTGTEYAPWYIISSEDKRYSRVTVLQLINQVAREQIS